MMVATNSSHAYIGSCYNLLHVSHSYMMPAIDFFFFFALYKEWIITYASNQAIYICMLLGWSAQTGAGKPLALRSAETTAPGPAQPTMPGVHSPAPTAPARALRLLEPIAASAGTGKAHGTAVACFVILATFQLLGRWPLPLQLNQPVQYCSATQRNAKAGGGGREAVACRNWPPGTPAGSRAINHKWPVKRVA